ncbi:PQQ-dependent sugar dehydrogenase [Halomonas sp. M4R1S46]|uniref:PQQ-dependent sugar dehydrogenase n=1 Tax=Halomonas sp. M4R1S46 TaxID=2982692 RepID=UPI0021E3855E|nr:PQQ-dependent sugar dehydrogenase [Halomonas sp. M4R1S46]UYG08536.1 PQQ-dependent sugar dehydrogenase [Halomonas sp. M4R1S46]
MMPAAPLRPRPDTLVPPRHRGAWWLAALLLVAGGHAPAATVIAERIDGAAHDVRLVRLAEGLEHPWSVAFLPDGRFLVSERPGRLALIDGQGHTRRIDGVPRVAARSQGGLLDLALHPEYGDGEHDWLYVSYARPGRGGTGTAVSRARLSGTRLTEVEEIFAQAHFSPPTHHYGGRLVWRQDGTLLLTIGDRGEGRRAQDGGDHAGSVIRLTETGGIPADNPFVDDPQMADAVYTLGNRNIQGLSVATDGTVWASEHGPRTGDEINRIEAGVNYGWPEVTLGRDYATNQPIGRDSAPGMRDPLFVFEGRYAPSGLAHVGSRHFPRWRGDLLAGGLRSQRLVRLSVDGDTVRRAEVLLDGQIGRIRDVRQGPDGYVYLLNDRPDGGLFRLEPAD